jgi:hypothetical protein
MGSIWGRAAEIRPRSRTFRVGFQEAARAAIRVEAGVVDVAS